MTLVVISSFLSCKAKQKTNMQDKTGELVFSLKKTACYGDCPIFLLKIYSDGLVKFHGEKFTEKTGYYTNQISGEELTAVINEFVNANFFEFEDEYTGEMLDLPTTYISFNYNDKTKSIKDYYGSPKELKRLEQTLDRYRKLENWTKQEKID